VLSLLLNRRRLLVAVLVVAGVGILAAHPTLAQSLGVDVWNVPSLQEELRAGEGVDRQLTDQSQEVRQRIAVKDAIVADLVAGRISLSEATERFAELNAAHPEYLDAIRAAFAGETDQEKMARNVIAFAVLRTAPDERDLLTARLEAELHQMTGSLAAE
jgi:hypothetical protein